MHEDITGIILSGGKSLRMGTNKSFLKIGEKTIIETLIDKMNSLFNRVLLITNEPDKYKIYNVELFNDIFLEKGPLGGIHSGLYHSETLANFIISCDIPLISTDVINFIIGHPSVGDIKVTRADGYIQQLCGIYNKNCLNEIENIFREYDEVETRDASQKKRKCKVLSLVERMNGKIIDIEKEYDNYKPNTFLNLNKPEDYQKLIGITGIND